MATIKTTTLSKAVLAGTSGIEGKITLASVTGINAPSKPQGIRSVIWIDRECMEVIAVDTTNLIVTVHRGHNATLRVFHAKGQTVWFGDESDFAHFMEMGLGLYGRLTQNFFTCNPVTYTDAAGSITMLPSDLLSGLILWDAGAGINATTPTATDIINALQSFAEKAWVGMAFEFVIKNTADGAETITVVAGTGVTLSGTATVAQSNAKRFRVVVTNVDAPAVTIYSLGTETF